MRDMKDKQESITNDYVITPMLAIPQQGSSEVSDLFHTYSNFVAENTKRTDGENIIVLDNHPTLTTHSFSKFEDYLQKTLDDKKADAQIKTQDPNGGRTRGLLEGLKETSEDDYVTLLSSDVSLDLTLQQSPDSKLVKTLQNTEGAKFSGPIFDNTVVKKQQRPTGIDSLKADFDKKRAKIISPNMVSFANPDEVYEEIVRRDDSFGKDYGQLESIMLDYSKSSVIDGDVFVNHDKEGSIGKAVKSKGRGQMLVGRQTYMGLFEQNGAIGMANSFTSKDFSYIFK